MVTLAGCRCYRAGGVNKVVVGRAGDVTIITAIATSPSFARRHYVTIHLNTTRHLDILITWPFITYRLRHMNNGLVVVLDDVWAYALSQKKTRHMAKSIAGWHATLARRYNMSQRHDITKVDR